MINQIKKLKWPQDKEKTKIIQDALIKKKKITPLTAVPRYVAGVDAAFFNDRIISVACLFKYPELTLVEEKFVISELTFPYIPGLLSFREGPGLIEAIQSLKKKPDVVIFDGQGIAHPKGLGIASFVGVLLDIPAIGCAKSRLVGSYEEPLESKGSWSFLNYKGKVVGAVVRTQDNVNPLFVSPGHRIDLHNSIKVVLGSTGLYRLTEPVRRADLLSKSVKRQLQTEGGADNGKCAATN
ncbi:MAG: endonuclease V [Deltaproteobacteria bacterium]|nr:endonuclease V [Deltaproteobacteria bacterium]